MKSHSQPFHCCPYCGENLEPAVTTGEKKNAIVRALGTGPKTLGALASGVYGSDTASNRRKVSYLIRKTLRPDVEPVDGKGTWRLAQPEAAE